MKHTDLARRGLPLVLALPFVAKAAAAQSALDFACPPGVHDASGNGNCIGASSFPTDGLLFPLGARFMVEPLGNVGLGTLDPVVHLDVVGTGGNPSTIRTLTTSSTGAGGLLLERAGQNPVQWVVSYDSGPDGEFVIHDNIAAQRRLSIDANGAVRCGRLEVGSAAKHLSVFEGADHFRLYYETPNSVSARMRFYSGHSEVSGRLETDDIHVGTNKSILFENPVGSPGPMIEMFESGTSNSARMVLGHSSTYDDWGLQYEDATDAFHFLGGGNPTMTVDLGQGVGIGTKTPSNILTVVQGSSTDPIADAWTTYSSRRWKENIEPLQDALETVQALRGVTYDWKKDGKHDIGLIAEEVGAVLPELVQFEENGVDARSVDYARLSAVLIEAVKELSVELDARERSFEALAARVESLERAAGR